MKLLGCFLRAFHHCGTCLCVLRLRAQKRLIPIPSCCHDRMGTSHDVSFRPPVPLAGHGQSDRCLLDYSAESE